MTFFPIQFIQVQFNSKHPTRIELIEFKKSKVEKSNPNHPTNRMKDIGLDSSQINLAQVY